MKKLLTITHLVGEAALVLLVLGMLAADAFGHPPAQRLVNDALLIALLFVLPTEAQL